MDRPSGGYKGPSWADYFTSVAEVEKELRCRVVSRIGSSKVRKTGGVVDIMVVRYQTPSRFYTIAQVDEFFPSRRAASLPALLILLLYEAAEMAHAFDARPHEQLRIEELPLPPSWEE